MRLYELCQRYMNDNQITALRQCYGDVSCDRLLASLMLQSGSWCHGDDMFTALLEELAYGVPSALARACREV